MPVWQYLKRRINIGNSNPGCIPSNDNRLYKSIQQKWQISTQIPILSISVVH